MALHVSCIAMAIGSVGVVMAGLVGVTERAGGCDRTGTDLVRG